MTHVRIKQCATSEKENRYSDPDCVQHNRGFTIADLSNAWRGF